jgi:transcriptional regulator of heat shock response
MGGGVASQIVGGMIALGAGILIIAAIYQLQQSKTGQASVLGTTSSVYNQTLTSIFK